MMTAPQQELVARVMSLKPPVELVHTRGIGAVRSMLHGE